jgi:hypothetical protein
MAVGFLQVSIGGSEAKGGLIDATMDENTITFKGTVANWIFDEARRVILARMTTAPGRA